MELFRLILQGCALLIDGAILLFVIVLVDEAQKLTKRAVFTRAECKCEHPIPEPAPPGRDETGAPNRPLFCARCHMWLRGPERLGS